MLRPIRIQEAYILFPLVLVILLLITYRQHQNYYEYEFHDAYPCKVTENKSDVELRIIQQLRTKTAALEKNFANYRQENKKLSSNWQGWYKRNYPQATNPSSSDPIITISSWTEMQPLIWDWFNPRETSFKWCMNLAPWMKCSYNPAREIYDNTHAVLFHPRHMSLDQGLPKNRKPHQKYIFFETEAPTNVWNYVEPSWDFWKIFNITATYTWDSDIPNHHHRFKCTQKANVTSDKVNYALEKTGKVAWFVSHCETSSRREIYVDELKKHIKVDIFGKCGTSQCNGENAIQCEKDFLESNYKFYLSFENAFCGEYSTEKLSRVLPLNIIPVVLGSYDYANILPDGSYINVRNFTSPQHLAEYLNFIDENDDEYNKFIERKFAYECKREFVANWHCQLCEYLHLHRYEEQRVNDAAEFWSVKQRCESPKSFYHGIADSIIDKINYTKQPDIFL